ncbi:beta-1,3-galactosyl-O-glycosyl-glycoprotein beta-1,6-N-acetylglucosaminyltransferase [Elysia marginata]|uniref:Beta-1,3-galactosyl-O-glycosyl-glycoprotein beta-1,6-N-acetylglucosaminyltransferase n=1 Tax=Elysia marginata TaxID=1093978 RepID=A0AAV4ETT5_9GAST|nr:beta-1,3-galactosyl-O-glycosyl-glycoprotein beta-1,6-N-acetylglucosaminyltransferase [Elysia marginata]
MLLTQTPNVTEVDCDSFFIPPEAWNETTESLAEVFPEAEKLKKSYKDCKAITSRWIDIPMSEFEQQNPIAFAIMIHDNLDRFERLLRAIYRTSNVYCVHVDSKSSVEFKRSVKQITSCFNNVFTTRQSIPVYWGERSVLDQEMICIRELWKHKVKWRWFINLTGEEFPLKTNLELVHILSILREFNDVWVDPCTEHGSDPAAAKCRPSTHARFRERWANAPLPPLYAQPFKGQIHVALSRAMIDYVLHNEEAKAIYDWCVTAKVSDEFFFSTLNANAHLRAPGSNAVLMEHPLKKRPSLARLKLWKFTGAEWPYCTFYLRGICLLSPKELTLLTTSWQLFANKFKPYHRPVGYACLEEWYFRKVVEELKTGRVQLDLRLYHKLYYQYLGI